MKALKWVGIALVGLVVAFFVVGFMLPKEFSTHRSIVVAAPPDQVFALVNDLEQHEKWSPWKAMDETMVITYGEQTVGEGASYSWTSDNSGSGSYVIASVVPNERIDTDLDFGDDGRAKGWWTFVAKDGKTEVTWGFSSEARGVIERYVGVMIDSLVGPAFDLGLSNVKALAEAG